MLRSTVRAVFVMVLLAAASCTPTFRQPEIAVDGVRLGSIGLQGGLLLVNVRVTNPNSFGLSANGLRYDLALDRAPAPNDTSWMDFASGTYDRPFSVGARQTSTVEIPVSFTFAGLGSAGMSLIRSGTFDYRARGTVDVNTPIGVRTVPFAKRGVMTLSGAR